MLSPRHITLDQRPRDQIGLVGSASTSVVAGTDPRSMPGEYSWALVATWDLQRKRGWEEIRKSVGEGIVSRRREGFSADGWLERAELSTCSRSPRILPQSFPVRYISRINLRSGPLARTTMRFCASTISTFAVARFTFDRKCKSALGLG
ncbi:hypothetical protein P691DRAFT_815470 [Macrolepiota fuliginosa MF-IS2]|uniref:Uncharacterized protein n=1 Tax=Macrolepiota fuliginosa MF-IS2 TaxID=1400762 RepID=A0A9P5X0E3_9AGAR|nr:hypothetical protein P691DRAFT_815470 [Macrolepiota fuliginosa MF-IS2]